MPLGTNFNAPSYEATQQPQPSQGDENARIGLPSGYQFHDDVLVFDRQGDYWQICGGGCLVRNGERRDVGLPALYTIDNDGCVSRVNDMAEYRIGPKGYIVAVGEEEGLTFAQGCPMHKTYVSPPSSRSPSPDDPLFDPTQAPLPLIPSQDPSAARTRLNDTVKTLVGTLEIVNARLGDDNDLTYFGTECPDLEGDDRFIDLAQVEILVKRFAETAHKNRYLCDANKSKATALARMQTSAVVKAKEEAEGKLRELQATLKALQETRVAEAGAARAAMINKHTRALEKLQVDHAMEKLLMVPSADADRRVQDVEEALEKEKSELQAALDALKGAEETARREKEAVATDLEKERSARRAAQEQLDAGRSETSRLVANLEKVTASLGTLNESLETAKAESAKQIEEEKKRTADILEQLDSESKQRAAFKKQLETLNADYEKIEGLAQKVSKQLASVTLIKHEKVESVNRLTTELEALRAEYLKEQKARKFLGKRVDVQFDARERAQKRLDDSMWTMHQLKERAAVAKTLHESAQAELGRDKKRLEKELAKVRGEKTTLESSLSTVQGEKRTLQSSLSAVQGEKQTLETSLSTVNGEKTTLQSSLSTTQNELATVNNAKSTLQSSLNRANASLASTQSSLQTAQTSASNEKNRADKMRHDWIASLDLLKPLYSAFGVMYARNDVLTEKVLGRAEAEQKGRTDYEQLVNEVNAFISQCDLQADTLPALATEFNTRLNDADDAIERLEEALDKVRRDKDIITAASQSLQEQLDAADMSIDKANVHATNQQAALNATEETRKSLVKERDGASERARGAESARKAAETGRKTAITAKERAEQAALTANTNARAADTARQTAESERDKARRAGDAAEAARKAAVEEKERVEREAKDSETTRQALQSAKDAAEAAQKQAQQSAETADQARQAMETAKNAAVKEKDVAEDRAKAADEARQQADEQAKNANESRDAMETAKDTAIKEKNAAEERAKAAEEGRAAAEGREKSAEEAREKAEKERTRAVEERGKVQKDARESAAKADTDRQALQTAKESAEKAQQQAEEQAKAADEARAAAEVREKAAEKARSAAERERATAVDDKEKVKKEARERATTADSDLKALRTAKENAEKAQQRAEERAKAAEEARRAAEDEVKTANEAHKTAQDAVKTAEEARKAAATERDTAVTERDTAVTQKEAAVKAMDTAKEEKQAAEAARDTAVKEKQTADQAQLAAEEARKAAEKERQAAIEAKEKAESAAKASDNAAASVRTWLETTKSVAKDAHNAAAERVRKAEAETVKAEKEKADILAELAAAKASITAAQNAQRLAEQQRDALQRAMNVAAQATERTAQPQQPHPWHPGQAPSHAQAVPLQRTQSAAPWQPTPFQFTFGQPEPTFESAPAFGSYRPANPLVRNASQPLPFNQAQTNPFQFAPPPPTDPARLRFKSPDYFAPPLDAAARDAPDAPGDLPRDIASLVTWLNKQYPDPSKKKQDPIRPLTWAEQQQLRGDSLVMNSDVDAQRIGDLAQFQAVHLRYSELLDSLLETLHSNEPYNDLAKAVISFKGKLARNVTNDKFAGYASRYKP